MWFEGVLQIDLLKRKTKSCNITFRQNVKVDYCLIKKNVIFNQCLFVSADELEEENDGGK